MAIMNLKPGVPPRTSANGLRINPGSTGSTTAQTATTNRKPTAAAKQTGQPSPTPTFSPVDNLVTSLDAQYELLADKTPWIAYAAAIAGEWALCANCAPAASPKKLFRQYNFNRALQGLPSVIAPPDISLPEPASTGYWEIIFDHTANIYIFTDWLNNPGAGYMITTQIGKGIQNNTLYEDPSTYGIPTSSGPAYKAALAIAGNAGGFPPPGQIKTTFIQCCTFNNSGGPGPKMTLEVHYGTV